MCNEGIRQFYLPPNTDDACVCTPQSQHNRSLTDTKLYCLVAKVWVACPRPLRNSAEAGLEPATYKSQVRRPILIAPLRQLIKSNGTILGFYFRFRLWMTYRHWHQPTNFVGTKLSAAELRRHIDFSTCRLCDKSTSGFSDSTCLVSLKCICWQNFDQVYQSVAHDVAILPVSENKRPPYWNSTYSVNFDIITSVYVSSKACHSPE